MSNNLGVKPVEEMSIPKDLPQTPMEPVLSVETGGPSLFQSRLPTSEALAWLESRIDRIEAVLRARKIG